MEDAALGRQPLAEDIEHVVTRVSVVDDDRQVQLGRQLQLRDEQLDLGLTIAVLAEIIQTDFAYGYHARQLGALFHGLDPFFPGFWTSDGETPTAWYTLVADFRFS
jgi:hypothetical protein